MAGFRLWENVTIEQLLTRLIKTALNEVKNEFNDVPNDFEKRLEHQIKHVLNDVIYASPACGTSSLCSPSEEGRAKPWSAKSAAWGLVSHSDPTLDH
jgi:hypothetical protein